MFDFTRYPMMFISLIRWRLCKKNIISRYRYISVYFHRFHAVSWNLDGTIDRGRIFSVNFCRVHLSSMAERETLKHMPIRDSHQQCQTKSFFVGFINYSHFQFGFYRPIYETLVKHIFFSVSLEYIAIYTRYSDSFNFRNFLRCY